MERRKSTVPGRRSAWDALRALLKKDFLIASNKILFGVYRKGWSANQKGRYRSLNPYPRGTAYWEEWDRGWLECSRMMKRRQSDASYAR